jgi:phenylalanyl-tRNA synthetase alpha chain
MTDTDSIKKNFLDDLAQGDGSKASLEALKVKYLGRKQGAITNLLADLASKPIEEKRALGPALNQLRHFVEQTLEERELALLDSAMPDMTLPGRTPNTGHVHPLTQTQNELEDIFRQLGFGVVDGPEIETDWFNFTALNMPELHSARDTQDTFYVQGGDEKLVLRTQTSPVQVRFMQEHTPPFSIISAGRVFRNEATDATHEHTFMQMEGLVVSEDVTFPQMVWTINHVLREFFGNDVQTKLLPSYFPFVEPGAEVAISSPRFQNGRWVELLGCGMVNQNVFEAAGYERDKYQGFAFGFGLTRFALMKYGIPDIRLFAENDTRFLKQF